MLTKRIIPCLDIKDGRTVKGVNFLQLRDAGDPVELGIKYSREGADELVFLDITATKEKRNTTIPLVREIARHLNIPFTIGGGISTIEDAERLLAAGADKISVNSAAVRNSDLIDAIAKNFGSQFLVVAIDAKNESGTRQVYISGGHKRTDKELLSWAKECQERGAGEILYTSMDHDGSKQGFAIEMNRKLSEALTIPIIASGGAGAKAHFVDVFTAGKADAGLAASIFHYNEIPIPELKAYLSEKDIPVRI